jgi:hypothetical protein
MTGVERWLDIHDYKGMYQISVLGRVRGIDRVAANGRRSVGQIICPQRHPTGYLQVGLSKESIKKRFYIHRLVLTAFVGPNPPNCEANHLNGNKEDNQLGNLEWISRSANHKHAFRILGKHRPAGELHGMSKLKDAQVVEIRGLFDHGISNKEIALRFNVHYNTIQQITSRRRWKHL